METTTLDQQEFWECLYNHKRICEAVVHEGAAIAKLLFRKQVQHLMAINGPALPSPEEAFLILLTTLNRSLYCYLLIHLNLSPTSCCFEARVHTHAVEGYASVIQAGERIIDCYSQFLSERDKRYQHIEKACVYIREHLHEDLNLCQICSQIYVSKSYLCAAFKELTGTTFCEYVRQQRLTKARMLLTSTALSIDDIAVECGFGSSAYFSTVFKRDMGMTPTVFRHSFGQNDFQPGAVLAHAPS